MARTFDNLPWHGRCESSSCLEMAEEDGFVYLRGTNDPDTVVCVTKDEWIFFVKTVVPAGAGD